MLTFIDVKFTCLISACLEDKGLFMQSGLQIYSK